MSGAFDPYRKWFGIPPEDQPPNHYRLLGIELFECDEEAIDNAATQRMAFVKRFQSGKHAVASQKILNELAAARVCLLDVDRKLQYNQQLRDRLDLTPGAPPPMTAEQLDAETRQAGTSQATRNVEPRIRSKPPKPSTVWDGVSGQSEAPVDDPLPDVTPFILIDKSDPILAELVEEDGAKPPPLPDFGRLVGKAANFLRQEVASVVVRLVRAIDKLLGRIAGDDNNLVHGFLRYATVVILVAVVGIVAVLLL